MLLKKESIVRIVACKDYRSFILAYKKECSLRTAFSYTLISRRAGFASRSFPRDVAMGLKKITYSSFIPMIRGLGLRGDLAEYFKVLVYREHPEICHPSKTPIQLESKLKNIRSRLLQKSSIPDQSVFEYEYLPFVYAACGGPNEEGASIRMIQKKTGLLNSKVQGALKRLSELNLIEKKGECYIPVNNHLFVKSDLGDQCFKEFYFFLLNQAAQRARTNFGDSSALFFTSCFSVAKTKLPELKDKLRQTLLEFVDASEEPSGDHLTSLVCSIF